MSNTTMQMMALHLRDAGGEMMEGRAPGDLSGSMYGMDMALLQECIEACSACEQACTMCAGSTMIGPAHRETGENEMMMMMAMCMNTADMCTAMMRMMMRPNGMNQPVMMSMLKSMMMMSSACAESCQAQSGMKPTGPGMPAMPGMTNMGITDLGMTEMGMSGIESEEMPTNGEMSEMALCAEVCRQCSMACQKMMDSMSAG